MGPSSHLGPAAAQAAGPARAGQRSGKRSLSLQRTTRGWALFDDHDQAVFEAEGPYARRLCLAHASTLGVLRLTFDEQLPAA